jgi:hypothetical protein
MRRSLALLAALTLIGCGQREDDARAKGAIAEF